MPVKVLLDSNFLMMPAQFHVDVFQGIDAAINARTEYVILSETVEELKRLAAQPGRRGRAAQLALDLAKRCTVLPSRAKPGKSTDELILETAQEGRLIVATNDSALKRRLRAVGIPVLYLRKKAYVAFQGAMSFT
ncbi:MAG: nucleotide-binding protein [Candidatus Bathyarchaeia archaeon]